jgi:benzodiazapine receptor
MAAPSPTPLQSAIAAAGFLILCLGIPALSGVATASGLDAWYANLEKPFFNPPNAVFAPVWTALYIMIAMSGWRLWRVDGFADRPAFAIYGFQLLLNLAWPFLFFGAQMVGAAFIEILVLWVAIVWNIAVFWKRDRMAGALLAPYLAWVSFAAVLNGAIWHLNF